MGLRSLILVCLLSVSAFSAVGCSKDAQKVQPETRGKRGETCLARNDCDTGLACLGGICAKNEFNIEVTAKQCIREECSVDKDCCGDRLTSAPEKCTGRDQICDPANRVVPGCIQTSCTTDATCNGGTCPMGTCQGLGQPVGTMCATAADCMRDTCVAGACTLSLNTCTVATQNIDCTYYNYIPSCSARSCNCINPLYDPTDPICTDEDCDNICLLTCQDSLCVEDRSCKSDADCVQGNARTCDGGRCVECTTNKDCDTKNDESCEKGVCIKPCEQNEECGLFEECQKDGTCKYIGCQTDRECILAASRGQQGTGGTNGVNPPPSDDPRLFKCLPSEGDAKINVCKIPCENDGSCGQFQACDQGFCKFVGCNSDEECRDYLGIANQMTSETHPYIATAKCVAPESASP